MFSDFSFICLFFFSVIASYIYIFLDSFYDGEFSISVDIVTVCVEVLFVLYDIVLIHRF